MQAGLDTGPVLLERATAIAPEDDGGSLHDRLAALGAELLGAGLALAIAGNIPVARAQADDGVTYAHKLGKAEARLDWNETASALARKVRAFDPWPVAEIILDGERLRVWSAQALQGPAPAPAGSIVAANREGIDIACADGVLRIKELQRDGGRRVAVADYLNARSAFIERVIGTRAS
jgi:methionyl-tRNA formyltransferase